jgi:two-component system, chemotaxis family, CheB/CheR fusion protein
LENATSNQDQNQDQDQKIETTSQLAFPIVGIGASAGGLAAFEGFFSGMPTDTNLNMAFILVQHLSPSHVSILPELLRRSTRMPVYEIEDGLQVRPNCVYIIPPNHDLALLNGTLQLIDPVAPRGHRLAVDFFFRSLAVDQRERAIGIILSGSGSDGMQGVRAIKGAGGMVIAQTPESAEFDSMPVNAVATGLVDYQLKPNEMAKQLQLYVKHTIGKLPPIADNTPANSRQIMMKIFIVLRNQTGHDFSLYKENTINRRIERRMAVHQIDSLDSYLKYLSQTPAEVEALFCDMLIGVTNFFRDPEAFDALKSTAVEKIFANKPPGSLIRVWSTGCSTGEEAYSLAILMQEQIEDSKQNFTIQIFATDIDRNAIAAARAGIYPASIAVDLSADRLRRFFSHDAVGNTYRIHKNIRDMLIFSEQDLIKDPPFSKLDLISCRNLLIYLGPELQRKVIPLFHYALNPGGLLFLGSSEGIGEFNDLFSVLDRKNKLFERTKKPLDRWTPPRFAAASAIALPPPQMQITSAFQKRTTDREALPLQNLTEQALLQQIAPAGALVNSIGDILYLHGRTGMYLEPAPGATGVNNIFKMCREGLRPPLQAALQNCVIKMEVQRTQHIPVKTNGHFTNVNIAVRPVTILPGETMDFPLFLIVIEEAPNVEIVGAQNFPEKMLDVDERIASLQEELKTKDEYLQSANEELESSNEELKSSNEEMLSVNEELQSTNEELETSKEELQSLNEELATVNAELHGKVTELSKLNNDMNNLLAGTGVATVFVDRTLKILRFTPPVTQIINLIDADIGRPVAHIVSNLVGYSSLVEDTMDVLKTLAPKELDVQTKSGRFFAMRIQPYRTLDDLIEGAVITFVDVSAPKRTLTELRESEERYRAVVDWTPAAILIHRDEKVVYANPAAVKMFGATFAQDLVNRPLVDLIHPQYRTLVLERPNKATESHSPSALTEIQLVKLNGQVIDAEVITTKIAYDGLPSFHMSMRDITEQKNAAEILKEAAELRRLAVVVRDAHDAITVQDLNGQITAWNPGATRLYEWSESEALRLNVQDRIPEALRKDALAKLRDLSHSDVLAPYQTQRLTKAGKAVDVWITATALLRTTGEIYAIATTERIAGTSINEGQPVRGNSND